MSANTQLPLGKSAQVPVRRGVHRQACGKRYAGPGIPVTSAASALKFWPSPVIHIDGITGIERSGRPYRGLQIVPDDIGHAHDPAAAGAALSRSALLAAGELVSRPGPNA